MTPAVLRRFIVLLFVAAMVVGGATILIDSFFNKPPGDYETERGDTHLSIGEYDKALEYFNQALRKSPDHRGAMMGRVAIFLQTGRNEEAMAELDHLIGYLAGTLTPDDATGRATLAAAYGNRGILKDRLGRYEEALADYVEALKVDSEAVSGPGLVDRILYEARPSTVRDRARYLYQELKKPEGERVMRRPEIDAQQRMYKP